MYYPKSQVKTNLYTNGGEFVIQSTNENYLGYYWTNSAGEYFSGKTPSERPTQKLIKKQSQTEAAIATQNVQTSILSLDSLTELESQYQVNSQEVINYIKLQGDNIQNLPQTLIPYYSPAQPTEQDYQNGEFRRFFTKKINEIIYIEIDKTQYDLLVTKNSSILWQLYFPFNIPWQISGDKEQVARTNKNIIDLTIVRLGLPKLGDYLNYNYLKYYK